MQGTKTIDLSQHENVNWEIYNDMAKDQDLLENGESIVLMQNNDCYVFPVTPQKTAEDYLHAVKSVVSSPMVYYHGYLTNQLLDVIHEEVITRAMNLEIPDEVLRDSAKDFEAIRKIMASL